jgi:hypothetical protein
VTISNTGVTSVSGTSPVASSGGATPAISLASGYGDTQNPYASKTANYVLAAPNGSAGAPTFRAIVAADIPTLNQNTTGTASNVTGTVAIANGGTGQTTATAAFDALAPSQTSNSGKYLTTNGSTTSWATVSATGTVTSVAATVPAFLSITGSPITTSGTLAIDLSGTALPVANGGTGVTTSTGSGSVVLGTSPTLTTPTINSAQVATVSGTAPLYMCRAWVNFNGAANTNLSGTYSRTSPSTTLTVTATAHGLIVGSYVNLDFTTGTGLDGIYTVVTVADANTFTVTTVASTTTSGNVTILRNTIRASGNVSSITDNATGDYTINFITAMTDTSYANVFGSNTDTTDGAKVATMGVVSSGGTVNTKTTSSLRVMSKNQSFVATDGTELNVAVFR